MRWVLLQYFQFTDEETGLKKSSQLLRITSVLRGRSLLLLSLPVVTPNSYSILTILYMGMVILALPVS